MATTQALGRAAALRPTFRRQRSRGWPRIDLARLWRFRELLWFCALRDVKVRYSQTALGAAWAVLQPGLSMVVFTVFFGRLAQIRSDGFPYPVFVYVALLPWYLFAGTLTKSSTSVVDNAEVLRKVSFPRLILPLSSLIVGLIDFAVSLVLLLAMLAYYRIVPRWAVVTLPLFVAHAVASALAVGLWLSALNVRYRDVRYTLPFIVQLWLLATPVAYPSSVVPGAWHALYATNPMVGVIEGFRWALLGGAPPAAATVAISVTGTLVLLLTGGWYFAHAERTFADLV